MEGGGRWGGWEVVGGERSVWDRVEMGVSDCGGQCAYSIAVINQCAYSIAAINQCAYSIAVTNQCTYNSSD
jgi:hypothetical protein